MQIIKLKFGVSQIIWDMWSSSMFSMYVNICENKIVLLVVQEASVFCSYR